jgi:glycosyltransferase involved in cell wall biosynthesis
MSAQQHIVIVGPAYPYRGGNALFVSYLYEALSAHFRITLLNYSTLYPSLLFPGTTQYDQSQTMVKHVPNERILSSVNPLSWWKTAQRIKSLQPDLVVMDWWNPFFGVCHRAVTTLLGKAFQHKILFLTENFVSHEARTVDRFLTQIGLHHASCFLALSSIVERDLKSLAGSRRIYRSELPVFDFYAQAAPESSPYHARQEQYSFKQELGLAADDEVLLFFGYVRQYKGLDVLLKAMPSIIAQRPRAKLLVAGEFYDDPILYTSLIKELRLNDVVIVNNRFIPNEEVYKFYAACDVVVQPYRSATQSGILNIAYGFGCPAVVTRVGGLEEYMDDSLTGVIAEPNSPESLAQAVLRFFALRDEGTDFAANVRRKASQNTFAQIHDVFSTILADCAMNEK